MEFLKGNSSLLWITVFIVGCQSTTFSLKTHHTKADDLHVIDVNSDRVRQKCLFLNAEAENNWRHQYYMYILNDKNEVLEIMQSTHFDKDTCNSQLRSIEKILSSEAHTKVCARGELKKDLEQNQTPTPFVGNNKVAYESLTFDSICNSKKCHSNNEVWVNTCPGFVKH